jgi:hypothetical protein
VTPSNRILYPNRPSLTAGLAAVVLAVAVFPADAATKNYSYRVELARTATKSQVRAGNVNWECRGKFCVASARGGNVSVRGCQELAGQVGRVVAYRSEIKQLGAADLDACNAAIAAGSPPTRKSPAAAGKAAAATPAERPSHVTTGELTFTGVHNWRPTR